MKQYVRKLSPEWWTEYGKKSGFGNFKQIYDMIENDGTTARNDRVIVCFEKNNKDTYALFNNFALIKESENFDTLLSLPRNATNTVEIATNKFSSKHDKEFAKYMVQTHDEKYKDQALTYRSSMKSSYQQRFDTITRKSNHYLKLIEKLNRVSYEQAYTFHNYSRRIEEYNAQAKSLNTVIKYESQVINMLENTSSAISEK